MSTLIDLDDGSRRVRIARLLVSWRLLLVGPFNSTLRAAR